MQRREKILALGFGVVVAAYAGNWLFQSALEGPLERCVAEIVVALDGLTNATFGKIAARHQ